MIECMCVSYGSEYGVPVKIVRLSQTFGPGVSYEDGRVFAQFARAAIENKNIVLKTKGETYRNYCYTRDAVIGILCVLLKEKREKLIILRMKRRELAFVIWLGLLRRI